jgi:hypothetical protein
MASTVAGSVSPIRIPERRAHDVSAGARHAEQGVRVAELVALRHLDGEPGQRRGEEGVAGADDRRQPCERPDRRVAREHERRKHALARAAGEVGAQHHLSAPEAVREHSTGQHEGDLGHDPGREHDAEAACAVTRLEHRERQRGGRHRRADVRRQVSHEEPAHVRRAQHREPATR